MNSKSFSFVHLSAVVLIVFTATITAQFPLKIRKLKVEKPKAEQSTETNGTDRKTNAGSDSFDVLSPPIADSAPRFLRDSVGDRREI